MATHMMKHYYTHFVLAASLLFSAAGCVGEIGNGSSADNTKPPVAPAVEVSNEPYAGVPAALQNTVPLEKPCPDLFKVKFETTAGDFELEVHRGWAPVGADRFYKLVKAGFYDDCKFFRVVPGFVVQFGINGNPNVSAIWRNATIKDDAVKESNKRGYITFATSGPNSRTTQLFINLEDNPRLDGMGFAPFGDVTKGMDVVDKIYSRYGERPDQGRIQSQGNRYLNAAFPELDGITKVTVISELGEPVAEAAPSEEPAEATPQPAESSEGN
ncbi:peptidylprolyl isomerase [Calycomorphotria hydatis]|uniref:Peptidyl-prolyl cis-trans isomerase n=1 Tax=Calycomorphotria hydatis TaxID=2528027 RepID=A0A517TBH8_9PLAN|nr:peptidylprolyl isomerase [Calycomorphotria hydatis]QDT65723.1 Peptidyl-prolyl cis-trans isomerase A precursor [Calycomorphotria hydatis]